jgi:hypothetical protein
MDEARGLAPVRLARVDGLLNDQFLTLACQAIED